MSRTRMLIIAFWIFIGFMLLWQFYDYDKGLTQQQIAHPQQEHFYFYHTNAAAPVAPTQARAHGADVEQTNFTVQQDTPSKGNFTCQVTLKNEGDAKAVGVQIRVRPYRGVSNYDEDVGQTKIIVVKEDDALSQFGDWLSFPDLAPGESSTQSVSFLSQSGFKPGVNPKPQILFETEKPKSRPPPLPGNGG